MEWRLDVAFIVSGTPAPGCDLETLWSANIRIALPAGHPLSGCEAIDWEMLKVEFFIFGRDAAAAELEEYATERIAMIGGRSRVRRLHRDLRGQIREGAA